MPWNPPTPIVTGSVAVSTWPNEQVVENWDALVATVPTTISALNTQWGSPPPAGAIGALKVGATPFDFLHLRYDDDLDKWVSEPAWYPMQSAAWNVTAQAVDTLVAVGNMLPPPLLPFSPYYDAGLILQGKCAALVGASATGSATTNGLYPGMYASDTGATSLTAVNQTFLAPAPATGLPAAAAPEVRGSDWGALGGMTPVDYMSPFAFIRQFGTGTANFYVSSLTIGLRWVSA